MTSPSATVARIEVDPAKLTFRERFSLVGANLLILWLLTTTLSTLCGGLIFVLVDQPISRMLLTAATGLVTPLVGLAAVIHGEVNAFFVDPWFPRALRLHARDANSPQPGPFGFGRSLRVAWLLCWRSGFVLPAALAYKHWLFSWEMLRQPVLQGGHSILERIVVEVLASVPLLAVAVVLLPLLVKWMLQKQYSGFTLFVTRGPINPGF